MIFFNVAKSAPDSMYLGMARFVGRSIRWPLLVLLEIQKKMEENKFLAFEVIKLRVARYLLNRYSNQSQHICCYSFEFLILYVIQSIKGSILYDGHLIMEIEGVFIDIDERVHVDPIGLVVLEILEILIMLFQESRYGVF